MPPPSEQDRQWMERALELAARSTGLASPNPAVGCVLVHGSEAVGEGFHEYDTRDHAEIVALRQAGDLARGATAYLTLEPCSHQGRTGPCADALLAAGVCRVVIATSDPNPLVHGQGIQRLLASGVEVSTGVLQGPARRINDAFARFIRSSLPFVTMKIASSLDGRIAPSQIGGPPFRITGEASRAEVHKMRHAADALLTGVGTILADDPLLTDRSGLPRRRPLLRVVLDSGLHTPAGSQLVATAKDDVLIFFSRANPAAERALQARGVRLERLEGLERLTPSGARIRLLEVMKRLAALEITSVLVEGGSRINAVMLREDQVDRLVIFYAPIFLGNAAASMLDADFSPRMTNGSRSGSIPGLTRELAGDLEVRRSGEDIAVEACLRDPWAGVS